MDSAKRYIEKVVKFCGGRDPYGLGLAECKESLPRNVSYYDIINYCIHKDSPFTLEMFRSYKSLEAYKYYESGFVQSIVCTKIKENSIIIAKVGTLIPLNSMNIRCQYICLHQVKHSQRMNEKPLNCWCAVDPTGIVLCGHCNCMAGLGEVCSHVASILFTLEAWGRDSLNVPNAVCLQIEGKCNVTI